MQTTTVIDVAIYNLDHCMYFLQVVSEKAEIIEHHRETEDELYEKGRNLLETVQETVEDNTSLHKSLMRKKQIQEANLTASQRFKETALIQLKDLNVEMKEQEELVRTFQDNIRCQLGAFSEEKKFAEEKLLEYISGSQSMLTEKVDNLLSDQLMWKEGQKQEISKFTELFSGLKAECLDMVRNVIEVQNSTVEKMRSYAASVTRDCNALVSTVSSSAEAFRSASQEVASKHHSSLNELSTVIHNYAKEEKKMSDNVKTTIEGVVSKQTQMYNQVGEEIQAQLMATFTELFNSKMQKVQEELRAGGESVAGNVLEQEKAREQMLSNVDSRLLAVNESITREYEEMVQSRKIYSEDLTEDIERVRTQTVDMEVEIVELEKVESDVESKLKESVEKHHECGVAHNEKVLASCSKYAATMDDKLEKLMSTNTEVLDCVQTKVSEGNTKTQEFVSSTIIAKDREIGLCVEHCKQCDDKVKLLQNTLVEFVEEEIVADNPTGSTPKPKKYSYPNRLRRTEDHEKIIQSYRQKTGSLPLPMLKPDGEFACEDPTESEESESDAASNRGELNTSTSSRSTIPSTGTEGDEEDVAESEEMEGSDDTSPYPTPQIRKTKQTNRCDGKENAGNIPVLKTGTPSTLKATRTPLSSANH